MIAQQQQPIKDSSKKQEQKNVQKQVKDRNQKQGRHVWTQNSISQRYEIDPGNIQTVDQTQNTYLKRNTFIFGILMVLVHAAICIVYGFKIQTPGISAANKNIINLHQLNPQQTKLGILDISTADITPILLNIFTIFVIIVGFGLLFSYNKKLVWSGMGFHLFICCFTIEFYFIVNNLINRIGFNSNLKLQSQHWNIHLWNFQFFHMDQTTFPIPPQNYIQVYGNTLLDAFKCGLANCIAFSAIRGRAGLLQAFILVLFGTVGFQFSRQILESLGIDFGYSNSIFTFGGFYGFSIAMIKYIRSILSKADPSSVHRFYQANLNSSTFSLIGLGILMVFFPILAAHPTFKQYLYFSQSFLLAPYSIYHSMSAGALMSLAFSFLVHGKANVRSFINGTVASGIAVLCSSYFIFNPGYPMVIGMVSSLLQVIIQGLFERKFIKRFDIISTYSFSLFGIQGLIGAAAGSIFQAIMLGSTQLNYYRGDAMKNNTTPIILGLMSAGIGIGIGVVVGFLISLFDYHRAIDNFHDQTYWQDEKKVFHQQEDQFQDWLELWQKLIPKPMPKP